MLDYIHVCCHDINKNKKKDVSEGILPMIRENIDVLKQKTKKSAPLLASRHRHTLYLIRTSREPTQNANRGPRKGTGCAWVGADSWCVEWQ